MPRGNSLRCNNSVRRWKPCRSRQPLLVDVSWQTNVEFRLQWSCDFVAEKRAKAAALRINSPDQLALVPAESERVIPVFRARRPSGPLPRQDFSQCIMVGKFLHQHWLIDRDQPALVRQQLANGDVTLAPLMKLRPVVGDGMV